MSWFDRIATPANPVPSDVTTEAATLYRRRIARRCRKRSHVRVDIASDVEAVMGDGVCDASAVVDAKRVEERGLII